MLAVGAGHVVHLLTIFFGAFGRGKGRAGAFTMASKAFAIGLALGLDVTVTSALLVLTDQ